MAPGGIYHAGLFRRAETWRWCEEPAMSRPQKVEGSHSDPDFWASARGKTPFGVGTAVMTRRGGPFQFSVLWFTV